VIRGAEAVARSAMFGARGRATAVLRRALVNGAAGVIMLDDGRPFGVWGFIVAGGKIVEIDSVGDPARLRQLGVADLAP